MKAVTLILSALLACGPAASPVPAAQRRVSEVLVLTGANVLDGVSATPLRGATVVVRGGLIASVSTRAVRVPVGARVINLGGRWLLPGLIDAHAHLRDIASARAALRVGVTTARSLGSNHFVDVGVRELHKAGARDVPDVVAAGYHVRRRMAEEFFTDAPGLREMMNGVRGPGDVRRAVRVMAGRGANVIKVMATERAGTPDTVPLRRVLTDEEVAAAVDEAKKVGLPVAAHAHSDEGARAAVLAGVRTVEHGTLLGEETLSLMRRRGVCFVPTVSFWRDMLGPGGEYDDPRLAGRAREMLPRVLEATALARRLGVRIAAGSDMRYDASSTLTVADEVAELIGAGLSPADALRAATSDAARCIGVGGRTGVLRPGMEADFIAVDGDPLSDVGVLRAPSLVVNDGRVVIDRLG